MISATTFMDNATNAHEPRPVQSFFLELMRGFTVHETHISMTYSYIAYIPDSLIHMISIQINDLDIIG
jgi:hypothetical protein